MANSNNNNIDEQMVKESLECPICKDFFDEPKQLVCGHTFCNCCISRLDKMPIPGTRSYEFDERYNVYGIEFSVQCPQCREMCKIPPQGLSTNYVVKEMVEKFREITMSVAADSSLDTGNNIEEKVICYSCSRKTSVNEMFLCKNCKVQNKSTKKLFMCSLCVIKSHKLHDVIMCSELATSKEREHASNRIGNICQKVYDQMQRMEAIEEGLSLEIDQIRKQLTQGLNCFDLMHQQCYDNESNLLKQDLEDKVNEAKLLEDHFNKAYVELNKIKEQTIIAFRNVQLFVSTPRFNKKTGALNINGQDLIIMSDSSNEPCCSSARIQNFIPTSTLTSPTNSFVYNEIDRKRRNVRQRKPPRRVLNRNMTEELREMDTIEIDAYVLD